MKAIVIKEIGNSSVLSYEEVDKPVIKPNEILVKNASIGVNFIDIYHRTGVYNVQLPFIPGLEGSGVVTEVGSTVKGFKVGDRVAYTGVSHSYAEFVAAPINKVTKLPDSIEFNQGSTLMLQGITAHYLLTSCFPVKKGTKLLIHAGAGGVGSLVVQMAKTLGAYVIATTSTPEKVALVKELGADVVINYKEQNFVEEVKRLTNNEGLDVVYDSVGKDTFPGSLDCLKPRGYFVLFGQSSGVIENFNPGILASKGSLFMTRPSIGNFMATSEEFNKRTKDIFTWIKKGKLKLIIDSEFSLQDTSKAHDKLESRATKGKVLLKP